MLRDESHDLSRKSKYFVQVLPKGCFMEMISFDYYFKKYHIENQKWTEFILYNNSESVSN